MVEQVEVTQADRDAAARMLYRGSDIEGWYIEESLLDTIRHGQQDHYYIVQAFAAHRLAALREKDARLTTLVQEYREMESRWANYSAEQDRRIAEAMTLINKLADQAYAGGLAAEARAFLKDRT